MIKYYRFINKFPEEYSKRAGEKAHPLREFAELAEVLDSVTNIHVWYLISNCCSRDSDILYIRDTYKLTQTNIHAHK